MRPVLQRRYLCVPATLTSSHSKCEKRCIVPDDLDVFSVLALAVPPLAVHDGRINVSRGEGVGLIQQRDHTEQDGPERRRQRDDRKQRERLK